MNDELQTFIEGPTPQNYSCARRAVLADAAYQPHLLKVAELVSLCDAERFEEVNRQVQQMMPQGALSPRVHLLAGQAARQLGDQQEADVRRYLMRICLEGLLDSGDGTLENPYRVIHTSDEYDVLAALNLQAHSQRLVESQNGFCDVITCEDGEEVWFEVAGLVGWDADAEVGAGVENEE